MSKNSKFKIGPRQEAWLSSLEKYPDRKTTSCLGQKEMDGSYKACCLGEALIIKHRIQKKKFPFNEGQLFDNHYDNTGTLVYSYGYFGLHNQNGKCYVNGVKGSVEFTRFNGDIRKYTTLASANDSGVTWPEIAKTIRKNPEFFFKESL